ncbi:putative NADH:flavin oxidoreductase 1 [Pterulicium gracile]|uniref:Putative NADH:flavin oxidoreductase 1 n=1 Tax=Pterulicium gracile TaxID=1884261 RepID=A0A5C3QVN8_9AGAR|nr:putative NADH:flavin oxidoreductase 1 [Pterula gracilis]
MSTSSNLHLNKAAPGVQGYFPVNEPAIGTPLPKEKNAPKLFQPLTLRGMTFKNRIFVAPMCQYSSDNGHATDWHLVHLGGYATRGAGAICVEATAVLPEGRISPEDAGLWTDTQIPKLQQIVNFCHAQGTLVGIQLAHAGRKASTYAPWVQRGVGPGQLIAGAEENGWPAGVVGPSEGKYDEGYPSPVEASEEDMQRIEDAFVAATKRAKEVGFDFIEIHSAHGYLLHSFLSPLSNTRTDTYGGQPLANRMRFPLRIVKACRAAWDKPLFVRISASDWAPFEEKSAEGEWKQWGIEQSTLFTEEMVKLDVDLLDVSSGGNTPLQKIPVKHGYQVPFAAHLKGAFPDLAVGAVGLISEPKLAEQYLVEGNADVIFLARTLMQNPHWPIEAARALGASVKAANQYERSWPHVSIP